MRAVRRTLTNTKVMWFRHHPSVYIPFIYSENLGEYILLVHALDSIPVRDLGALSVCVHLIGNACCTHSYRNLICFEPGMMSEHGTPMASAVYRNYLPGVQLILDVIGPGPPGKCVFWALHNKNTDMLMLLLKNGYT